MSNSRATRFFLLYLEIIQLFILYLGLLLRHITSPNCSVMSDSLLLHGLPGSSVHGILQARILEWVASSFFRESSWHRNWTQVSHIAGGFFTIWTTREAHVKFIIHFELIFCELHYVFVYINYCIYLCLHI